ncbi:MAG: CCA tRNA nucleotidyltransferase [Telmatospirillum sp.]|nr:CCA tRNA nucleotidyltransferase [Telmatospirillum sp.]
MADSSDFRLSPLPLWAASAETRALRACLGPQLRFVGGCVRDALAGLVPNDLDLAGPDRPEAVMAKLEAAGLKAIATGLAHGTVTAIVRGRRFEITTLRRDVATDGRHATVEFTDDWRLDAARRDFTINALSMDADGAVFDYFGGRDDLAAGRVRFVGDAATRIAEDYLRVLRLFRFHARFGRGPLDAAALAACAAAADRLQNLSAERVHSELFGILAGPKATAMLDAMRDAGLFAFWLPELESTAPLARLLAVAGQARARVDAILALASLLSATDVAAVAARLRLSRAETARLQALCAPAVRLDPASDERQRRAAFYRLGDDPAAHVLLQWSQASDAPGFAARYEAALAWVRPKFPLSGEDARRAGFEPGPAMGAWLKAREEEWIEAGCP